MMSLWVIHTIQEMIIFISYFYHMDMMFKENMMRYEVLQFPKEYINTIPMTALLCTHIILQ